jgi:hypothetical protein
MLYSSPFDSNTSNRPPRWLTCYLIVAATLMTTGPVFSSRPDAP